MNFPSLMDGTDDLNDSFKIAKIADLEDGSSVYDMNNEIEEEGIEEPVFDENLAEFLGAGELTKISSELLDGIDQDIDSRKEWEETVTKGLSYLGIKLEDYKNVPFMQACRAFDSTILTAHLRYYSTARAELFPASGPVDISILGQPNDYLYEKSEKIKKWNNYYLTDVDKEYYPDSERLLWNVGLIGCGFRKVYIDPILNRPIARFIEAQNLIVNNDCVTLLSSDRITQVFHLSKTDIMLRQQNGFYRDIDLPYLDNNFDDNDSEINKKIRDIEGVNLSQYDKRSLYKLYEVHANLFIQSDPLNKKRDIPFPYIITICPESRKILSIRRNWEENDPTYRKINYFIKYNYLSGPGLYGIGLIQLLISNAIVATSITRQLIDKGSLNNFPGGVMVSGMRIEQNDNPIGPAEFRPIETGGLPIQQAVMTLPYGEPSQVLRELRNDVIDQMRQVASTAETAMAESNRDMPVGTTLALLESSNKIQTAVFKSLHVSLTDELQLLYDLFRKNFPQEKYMFDLPKESIEIGREDFLNNIKLLPKADPEVSTSIQRIIKAESVLKVASMSPQLYDMRAVNAHVLKSMGIQDIDEFLPSPPKAVALDPITENMNIMMSKPVVTAAWQDHKAHIFVHQNSNAAQTPEGQAHIQDHMAQDYLQTIQMSMGFALPPLDQLKDPNIQNQVAMAAVQATQQLQQQQQQANPPPIDPNQVMMADIEQRREATKLRAEEAKLKAETEAFKAQLSFETEQSKMEAQKEIAQERNETSIELEHLKHQGLTNE